MRGLVLVGYRGSGKTSFGSGLAARCGLAFVDADAVLTERFGVPIGDYFASHGEAAFRDAEERLLAELLPATGGILATGGGCVERAANRAALLASPRLVVYLSAPVAVLQARLRADPNGRPALLGVDPASEVSEILARREPWYRMVAGAEVASDRDPQLVLAELAELAGC